MKYMDEILSKKEDLTTEQYEQELIKNIEELEQDYSRILKLNFKSQDLFGKKVLKRKVKPYKQKLRFLQNELDTNYGYNGSIYNNISYSIIKFDYLFKTNMYSSFYKVKFEKDPKKRLKIYRKVFVTLIENYNKIDNYDYKYKKIANDLIDLFRKKIYKEKANVKKLIKNEIVEEKENTIIENKTIKEEIKDYVDISNPYILKNDDLKEVMDSFRNMVRKSKITEDYIDYVSIIRKRLIDEEVMDENYELINSVIDSLKYRKLYLKKSDKKEKNIIRLCINELKELSEQISIHNTPIAEAHDYKFELLFELLRDKNNYTLIKKIVEDYPVVVNVRNNKRSILSYILQLYLNNYMMILNEHKYNYNIDYLKEVYILFMNSSSLYLSCEDKIEIDSIIDEFIYKLNESDVNSKRKNYAINEVKQLYSDNDNNEFNYYKKVDRFLFDANMKDIEFLDSNHSRRPTEIDLTNEHTFMLENPYVCYSFTEEKGIKSLKVHTVDFSNIVEDGSALDKYVYNCLLDNKKVKGSLLDYLEFKSDEIVSALTYDIIMDNDRNIKDFKIYKSRIKVDGGILDYSNNQYVYQNLRRISNDYIQKFKDVKLTGLSKLEYIINDIVNKQYIKLSRKENLPIIAKKELKTKSIDPETFSKIKNIFNKLPKRDYKRLAKIFNEEIVEKYYDDKVNYKEYNDLSIVGNPNYIYLLNQRMLKSLLLNDYPISQGMYSSIKQKTIEEYEELIKVLNDLLGYKTEEDFDYKKRRNFKSYILSKED